MIFSGVAIGALKWSACALFMLGSRMRDFRPSRRISQSLPQSLLVDNTLRISSASCAACSS